MELEKAIIQQLKKHPEGLRGKKLATLLGVEKQEVNRFLHNNKDKFYQNEDYEWFLKSTQSIKGYNCNTDFLLDKLENKENAKKFTKKQFESLADWSDCSSHSENGNIGIHYTKTGKEIEYDSKSEKILLDYIEKNDLAIDYAGQSLCIKYDSFFVVGKSYYPDIVMLTKDYRIAIIEVKPLTSMSYHLNISKYFALKSYCEENGFMYMMVDPASNFMTFEELKKISVSKSLYEFMIELENEYGMFESMSEEYNFNSYDVDEWYEEFGKAFTKTEFKLMVHSIIINRLWYNKKKHSFEVYNYPHK